MKGKELCDILGYFKLFRIKKENILARKGLLSTEKAKPFSM